MEEYIERVLSSLLSECEGTLSLGHDIQDGLGCINLISMLFDSPRRLSKLIPCLNLGARCMTRNPCRHLDLDWVACSVMWLVSLSFCRRKASACAWAEWSMKMKVKKKMKKRVDLD